MDFTPLELKILHSTLFKLKLRSRTKDYGRVCKSAGRFYNIYKDKNYEESEIRRLTILRTYSLIKNISDNQRDLHIADIANSILDASRSDVMSAISKFCYCFRIESPSMNTEILNDDYFDKMDIKC